MYDQRAFVERMSKLRQQKGITAREMSLYLGLNPSYISRIESMRMVPSLPIFFEICDCLGVSPREFFTDQNQYPLLIREITADLMKLPYDQLMRLSGLIADLAAATRDDSSK